MADTCSDLAHDFMAGERLENMILVVGFVKIDVKVDLDERMVVLRERNIGSVVLRRMAMYVAWGFEEGEV